MIHPYSFLSTRNTTIYLLIYVDDIIVTRNDSKFLNGLISNLGTTFSLKNLGNLSCFHGIEVIRDSKGLHLSQEKFGFEEVRAS